LHVVREDYLNCGTPSCTKKRQDPKAKKPGFAWYRAGRGRDGVGNRRQYWSAGGPAHSRTLRDSGRWPADYWALEFSIFYGFHCRDESVSGLQFLHFFACKQRPIQANLLL
jgi:hypothetical protein